jgi:hypothetical protein
LPSHQIVESTLCVVFIIRSCPFWRTGFTFRTGCRTFANDSLGYAPIIFVHVGFLGAVSRGNLRTTLL